MGRTRRALHALLKLRPARALVRAGNREIEVEAESVQVGERVIVKPGEGVPVDGVVLKGASLIDQSHLTGESVPVEKGNGGQGLRRHAESARLDRGAHGAAAGDTTLARIVSLVREAQEQKSSTEEVAEWVGRYYTIAVMVAAGLMMVIPPLFMGHAFQPSLYRAMTLLVVASPMRAGDRHTRDDPVGDRERGRNGVLFKGGRFIEALGRVRRWRSTRPARSRSAASRVTECPDGGRAEDEVLGWARQRREALAAPARAGGGARRRRGLEVTPPIAARTWARAGRAGRRRSGRDRNPGVVRSSSGDGPAGGGSRTSSAAARRARRCWCERRALGRDRRRRPAVRPPRPTCARCDGSGIRAWC
jgi:Cd2+/Zn2+-exporting ATPase